MGPCATPRPSPPWTSRPTRRAPTAPPARCCTTRPTSVSPSAAAGARSTRAAVSAGSARAGAAGGGVVTPPQVAGDAATRTWDRDQLEAWLQHRVADGASIRGTYPPDDDTLAEYRRQTGPS